MFHTGRPIGTEVASGSATHSQYVTSTDASVGPYKLCSPAFPAEPSVRRNRSASAAGSASPLQITRRRPVHPPTLGSARNAASMDGTKCTVVTRSARISSARYAESVCPSGLATTSVAPVISGQKNSHTDTSKLDGVFCSTRSSAPRPYCACIHSSRFTMPRCGTSTTLGRPVEPAV